MCSRVLFGAEVKSKIDYQGHTCLNAKYLLWRLRCGGIVRGYFSSNWLGQNAVDDNCGGRKTWLQKEKIREEGFFWNTNFMPWTLSLERHHIANGLVQALIVERNIKSITSYLQNKDRTQRYSFKKIYNHGLVRAKDRTSTRKNSVKVFILQGGT